MDPDLSRRRFVVHGCTAAALIGLGIPLAACDGDGGDSPPSPSDDSTNVSGVTVSGNVITIDLTKSPALGRDGGFQRLRAQDVIAVNVGGTVHAFSNVCTHEGNEVSQFTNGQFRCPTHGATFAASTGAKAGTLGSGPLLRFQASKSGSTVTITLPT